MNSVKAKLESVYGTLRIHGFHPRRGVYLIPGPKGAGAASGAWVLKQLKVGAGKAYLTGKLLTDASLRQLTPGLIQTESGSYYLWIGGNRYHLTNYLEGAGADYYRIADLQAAICSMALFHRLTRQLITRDQSSWALIKFNLFQEWQKRLAELKICRDLALKTLDAQSIGPGAGDLARKYLQLWPECYSQTLQAYAGLMDSDYASGASNPICYHDWAHHNLIIRDGTAFLIDFDYMLIDHPAHDRANLAGHYLRLHQWSLHSLDTILERFARDYPFGPGELKLLRLFLLFPYDFWILGRQYFIEKQPWSLKYYQTQWDRKINLYKHRNRLLDVMERLCT
ncbi:MAG: phosphotransferase [Firmicutes bacterium]|nr:phosphotransferase [Bacillota bacterium]